MAMRMQYQQRFEALQPIAAPSVPSADGWLFVEKTIIRPLSRQQPQSTILPLQAIPSLLPSLDWLTSVPLISRPVARPQSSGISQPTFVPTATLLAAIDWIFVDSPILKQFQRLQHPSTVLPLQPISAAALLPSLDWMTGDTLTIRPPTRPQQNPLTFVPPVFTAIDWHFPAQQSPRASQRPQSTDTQVPFVSISLDWFVQDVTTPRTVRRVQVDSPFVFNPPPLLARLEWLFYQPYLKPPPWKPHPAPSVMLVEFSTPAAVISRARTVIYTLLIGNIRDAATLTL